MPSRCRASHVDSAAVDVGFAGLVGRHAAIGEDEAESGGAGVPESGWLDAWRAIGYFAHPSGE